MEKLLEGAISESPTAVATRRRSDAATGENPRSMRGYSEYLIKVSRYLARVSPHAMKSAGYAFAVSAHSAAVLVRKSSTERYATRGARYSSDVDGYLERGLQSEASTPALFIVARASISAEPGG